MGVIVLGVGHSAAARAGLRFALEEARLRQAALGAVRAIDSFGTYPSLAIDFAAVHRAAEELIEDATTEVAAENEDVEIERRVIEGAPGNRHGGFAGLLLGSVSQQCSGAPTTRSARS